MNQGIVALTEDLYGFLLASEAPLSARRASFAQMRDELMVAAERISLHLAAERDRVTARMRTRLDEAKVSLQAMLEEFRAPNPEGDRLEKLWKGLGTTYEALRAQLRKARTEIPAGTKIGAIKPKNYTRNIFHLGMAMTGVLTYEYLLDRTGVIIVMGILCASFTIMEVMRRASETWNRRFVDGAFRHISRPGEAHQIPAATWYGFALLLGALYMPKEALQLGVLALGFGDPAAQIIGKRFGRTKLVGQKSLQGVIAFIAATAIVSTIFLLAIRPAGDALAIFPLVLIAPIVLGVVGAVAELFSGRVDDNFTIPITVGTVAMLFVM